MESNIQKESATFILRQHLTNEVSLELLRKIKSKNVARGFCILRLHLSILHTICLFYLSLDVPDALSGFSISAIAAVCIGIRQFLLDPNSTITVSS